MTVSELRELIEDLPDHCEVRIAHQPNYPFELSVSEARFVETRDEDEDETPASKHGEPEGVLYIAEGNQIGYLPGNVSRELNWR